MNWNWLPNWIRRVLYWFGVVVPVTVFFEIDDEEYHGQLDPELLSMMAQAIAEAEDERVLEESTMGYPEVAGAPLCVECVHCRGYVRGFHCVRPEGPISPVTGLQETIDEECERERGRLWGWFVGGCGPAGKFFQNKVGPPEPPPEPRETFGAVTFNRDGRVIDG